MKFNYYAETDSLYIDFSAAPSAESIEVSPGVIADFDAHGKLVGFDIEHASKLTNLNQFTIDGFKPSVEK